MDIYEELAMLHLTRNKNIFVIPQYDISNGWSCPDFVGIDFENKKLLIVEVTASSYPKALINRIRTREKQWFSKLREEFDKFSNVCNFRDWPWIIRIYVRDICKQRFNEFPENALEIFTFEEIGFSWNSKWYIIDKKKN